jgi:hypothetical protein
VSNILPCLPVQAGSDLNTLATTVRTEHQAVGYAARNVLEHAMAAGDALIAARALIPEGRWGRWLRNHCDLSERHARRYVTLATAREEIEERTRVSAPDLSLRGALKLIQKRAPSSDGALPVRPKPTPKKKAASSSTPWGGGAAAPPKSAGTSLTAWAGAPSRRPPRRPGAGTGTGTPQTWSSPPGCRRSSSPRRRSLRPRASSSSSGSWSLPWGAISAWRRRTTTRLTSRSRCPRRRPRHSTGPAQAA